MPNHTNLIRASELQQLPERAFSHPLNPHSLVFLKSLSAWSQLARLGLHIGRVPAGHESFAYHFHHTEEEFIYILKGRGMAEIGDEHFDVAAGDFMLFTAPSPGHHLTNTASTDLVYLMGGESHDVEVGDFPRLGKRVLFEKAKGALIIDVASCPPFIWPASSG